jgi:hypothetical protein
MDAVEHIGCITTREQNSEKQEWSEYQGFHWEWRRGAGFVDDSGIPPIAGTMPDPPMVIESAGYQRPKKYRGSGRGSGTRGIWGCTTKEGPFGVGPLG